MARRYELLSVLMVLSLALCASGAWAQWVTNGVPVCNADYQQMGQQIVQDGPDGAIIVWTDYRNGIDSDIYANRIGTDGSILAGLGGVPLCTANGNQYEPRVIVDGVGGAIFVWLDDRDGYYAHLRPESRHDGDHGLDERRDRHLPLDSLSVRCPDRSGWSRRSDHHMV